MFSRWHPKLFVGGEGDKKFLAGAGEAIREKYSGVRSHSKSKIVQGDGVPGKK